MGRTQEIKDLIRTIEGQLSSIEDMTTPFSQAFPVATSALMKATLWLLDGVKMSQTPEGQALEKLCLDHKRISQEVDMGEVARVAISINRAILRGCSRGELVSKLIRASRAVWGAAEAAGVCKQLKPCYVRSGDRMLWVMSGDHTHTMLTVKTVQVGTASPMGEVDITTSTGEVISISNAWVVLVVSPLELPPLDPHHERLVELEAGEVIINALSDVSHLMAKDPNSLHGLLNENVAMMAMGHLMASVASVASMGDGMATSMVEAFEVHLREKLNGTFNQLLNVQQLQALGEDAAIGLGYEGMCGLQKVQLSILPAPFIRGLMDGVKSEIMSTIEATSILTSQDIRDEHHGFLAYKVHELLTTRTLLAHELPEGREALDMMLPGGLLESQITHDLVESINLAVSVAREAISKMKKIRDVSPPRTIIPSNEEERFLSMWQSLIVRRSFPGTGAGKLMTPQQAVHVILFQGLAINLLRESGLLSRGDVSRDATNDPLDETVDIMETWDVSTHNGVVRVFNPLTDCSMDGRIMTNSFTGLRALEVLQNALTRSWVRVGDVGQLGEVKLLNRLPGTLSREDIEVLVVSIQGPQWVNQNSGLKVSILEALCVKTNQKLLTPAEIRSGHKETL